jgi:hypothetical protein
VVPLNVWLEMVPLIVWLEKMVFALCVAGFLPESLGKKAWRPGGVA